LDVLTPSTYKGRLKARAQTLWRDAQGWVEDLDGWWADTVVERNADDPNRLDILLRPDIINNAMVFAHKIQPKV
jgi:phage tail sheath gpL-like